MGRDGRCRDCRRQIMFVASSTTGRPMALDPYPQDRGNIRLRETADGLVADVLSKGKAREAAVEGVLTYKVHQSTCPALHPPDEDTARPEQLQLGGSTDG